MNYFQYFFNMLDWKLSAGNRFPFLFENFYGGKCGKIQNFDGIGIFNFPAFFREFPFKIYGILTRPRFFPLNKRKSKFPRKFQIINFTPEFHIIFNIKKGRSHYLFFHKNQATVKFNFQIIYSKVKSDGICQNKQRWKFLHNFPVFFFYFNSLGWFIISSFSFSSQNQHAYKLMIPKDFPQNKLAFIIFEGFWVFMVHFVFFSSAQHENF